MNAAPDRHLPWKIAAISVAMFAFGFALRAALRRVLRDHGLRRQNGARRPSPSSTRPTRAAPCASSSCLRCARGAPFTLEPEVSHMEVHPGQLYETHFRARNLTGSHARRRRPCRASRRAPRRAISTRPSASASRAKSSQPHEELTLKLAFMVAAELPAHVDTLSLSYTYFSAAN